MNQVITAIGFCHEVGKEDYFAVGCVDGGIHVGKMHEGLQLLNEVKLPYRHTESVNSIKWNGNLLATCSNDFSVRIFEFNI